MTTPIESATLVDGWYIPDDEVEQYCADREHCAALAAKLFTTFCHEVTLDWAGSEDGEAVVGLGDDGELIALVHLDPRNIEMLTRAEKQGRFDTTLLRISGLSPKNFKKLVVRKAQLQDLIEPCKALD